MNANIFLHRNTLDRTIFPIRGWKLNGELDFIFGQDGRVQFLQDGLKVLDTDSLDLLSHNYQRFILNAEGYIPINTRAVLTGLLQTGMNFNYKSYYLNSYSVGGLTAQFRNQVLFAGLPENSVFTASVASAQLGVRQLLFQNGYGLAKANILLKDFITETNTTVKPGFLSGYSLGFAYNFALGPLEVSAMYCDQSKRVLAYVNFGFAF
jgi:NTE family protein